MFYDLPPSRRKGIRLRYAGTDRPLTLNTPQRFHEEEDAFIRRELRRKLKEKKEKEKEGEGEGMDKRPSVFGLEELNLEDHAGVRNAASFSDRIA